MSEQEEKEYLEKFPRVSFDEFTIPTYDEWKLEVEKALKGGSFDKKMFTKTYEGIVLEPIYTPNRNELAIEKATFPGSGDFRRGTKASGYITNAWGISQCTEDSLPTTCNESLQQEIEKGGNVYHINFDMATTENTDAFGETPIGLGGVSVATLQDMSDLLNGLHLDQHPVYAETGASSLIILSMMKAVLQASGQNDIALHGTIGADPIGTLAASGTLLASLDACCDEMAHTVIWAKENAPELRTILVSGDVYHNGGGNDVQEIAFTLATATYYVRQMQYRNIPIDTIADAMQFTFSLGANFFMEIAKLRALRLLWAQILEAFGASPEKRKAVVHGRTSKFTKTVYDPYVNLLRNTTQAFSGVVGGIDTLEVGAFDEPVRKNDAFSRRIARNTQIMMQEEFELRQPIDPAGGSWYIETLALELADKIWKEFQTVEAKGGIVAALHEEYPQEAIATTLKARFSALEKRSDVAVGNNMYPNMTEELLDPKTENQEELDAIRRSQIENYKADLDEQHQAEKLESVLKGTIEPGAIVDVLVEACLAGATIPEIRTALAQTDVDSMVIKPIAPHRWTERFEELRMTTEIFKKEKGTNLKVFLANMGPIPQHKPRADFTTGFMEVAAFEVLKNDGFSTVEEATQAACAAAADVVVICSTDATYPEIVPALAPLLKTAMPNATIFLAGMPAADMESTYKEAGVDDFIHVRANCYTTLRSLQDKKGMVK